MLFGGFQPLFQALSPADINRLSYEIIQVFQGEGGTVESLLTHVASLTNSLADKDAVIGSVIDNLTTVLGNVAARDQKLSDLIVSLQQFVTGLASDKDAIFNSLQTIDTLADSDQRPARRRPVRRWPPTSSGLGKLSDEPGRQPQDVLEGFLKLAPTKIDLITRTAINGSWFNFFLCCGRRLRRPARHRGERSADRIPVPAGGLNNGATGCGGDGPRVQAVPRPQPGDHRRGQPRP